MILVVANYGNAFTYGNGISVYLNNGSGTFGSKTDYTYIIATGVAIADLNGDGKLDLAASNSYYNSISVLTNTGNGLMGSKIDYASGSNPYSVTIGDINKDAKLDLIVVNYNNNSVSVLTNTGTGSFGSKVDYSSGSNPYNLVLGDITNDNNPDIIVSNYGSNTVSVLTGSGLGFFSSKTDYIVGSNPTGLKLGDFNNDGKLDLVVANSNSNTFSLFLAKDSQQIGGLPNNKIYGQTFTINATSTSGLPLNYSTSNNSILNISGNSATATGIGVVTITAFQSGNGSWFGVTTTGVITVTKANLSVQANNASRIYNTANPIFSGITTGLVNGDAVSVSYFTPATSLSGVGTYPIYASVTGSALVNYSLTTVAGTLTINKAPQTITFPGIGYVTYSTSIPTNITVSSGLPVSLSVTGSAAVIIANNNVSFVGIGNVTVTAFQLGDANYLPAASVARTFTVYQGFQSFTIVGLPGTVTYSTPPFNFDMVFTSGLPASITFAGPAALANNIATVTGLGVVTVTAFQGGNTLYRPTTVVRYFQVFKANQTINFPTLGNKVVSDPPFSIAATATSGLVVSFSVTGPAAISGNTITLTGATGTVSVVASQLGNTYFNSAANVTRTFTVNSGSRIGIENNDIVSTKAFTLYPNPNQGNFTIAVPDIQTESLTAKIYNAQGGLALEISLKAGINEVNTLLPKGIYLLKSVAFSAKIVVE